MRNLSQNRYWKALGIEDDSPEAATPETDESTSVDGEEAEGTVDVRQEEMVDEDSLIKIDAVGEIERTNTHLESIKHIPLPVDIDSVEAFTLFSPGGNFMTKFADYIVNFTDNISNIAKDFIEKINNINLGKGDYLALSNHAKKYQYFSISSKTELYQPTKLGVDWLTYSKYLKEMTELTSRIDQNVLGPIQAYLAKIINDPNILMSASFKPKYTITDTEKLQKEMAAIFNGPQVEKTLWGNAFKRNEDVTEFVKNMSDIKRNCDALKPDTVAKSVSVISERANLISESIKKNDSKYTFNPKQTKYLSEVLFVCAKYTELYAVVIQLVYELEQCINISQQKLLK